MKNRLMRYLELLLKRMALTFCSSILLLDTHNHSFHSHTVFQIFRCVSYKNPTKSYIASSNKHEHVIMLQIPFKQFFSEGSIDPDP